MDSLRLYRVFFLLASNWPLNRSPITGRRDDDGIKSIEAHGADLLTGSESAPFRSRARATQFFLRIRTTAPENLLPGWQNLVVTGQSSARSTGVVRLRAEPSERDVLDAF